MKKDLEDEESWELTPLGIIINVLNRFEIVPEDQQIIAEMILDNFELYIRRSMKKEGYPALIFNNGNWEFQIVDLKKESQPNSEIG